MVQLWRMKSLDRIGYLGPDKARDITRAKEVATRDHQPEPNRQAVDLTKPVVAIIVN